jgi:hypothetical protein
MTTTSGGDVAPAEIVVPNLTLPDVPQRDRRFAWTAAASAALHAAIFAAIVLLPLLRAPEPTPPPAVEADIVTPSELASLESSASSASVSSASSAVAPSTSSQPISSEAASSSAQPSSASTPSSAPSSEAASSSEASSEAASSQTASSAQPASSAEPSSQDASSAASSVPPKPMARPVVIPVGPSESESLSESEASESSVSASASMPSASDDAASSAEANSSAPASEPASLVLGTTASNAPEGEDVDASSPPPASSASASTEPAPAAASPQIKGALHVPKRFYAQAMLRGPGMEAAKAAIAKLPPQRRMVQMCNIEAMAQVGRAASRYNPDALIANAFAPPASSGQTFTVSGGAFRSGGNWYGLSFACTVTADSSDIANFSFRIGDAVSPQQLPQVAR